MRLSRLYTPQPMLSVENVELTGKASHYLTRVLRVSEGDSIILFNGDGRDYSGEICGIQRDRLRVKINGSQVPDNESPLRITQYIIATCPFQRPCVLKIVGPIS